MMRDVATGRQRRGDHGRHTCPTAGAVRGRAALRGSATQVVDKAKACILHCIGVGLAGHGSGAVKAARMAILAEEGRPSNDATSTGATVLVTGERATPYGAAFVNSSLMHAKLQEDAYHTGSH